MSSQLDLPAGSAVTICHIERIGDVVAAVDDYPARVSLFPRNDLELILPVTPSAGWSLLDMSERSVPNDKIRSLPSLPLEGLVPPIVLPVVVRFLAYITVKEDHCGLECEVSDGKRILIEFSAAAYQHFVSTLRGLFHSVEDAAEEPCPKDQESSSIPCPKVFK
jgi:hypothetical protein